MAAKDSPRKINGLFKQSSNTDEIKYAWYRGGRAFKWSAAWQKQQNDMCPQRSLRSAWASDQSDQSLQCPHDDTLGPYLSSERTVKTLIRLGGFPGWSESSLGAHAISLDLSWGGSNKICLVSL